MSEGNKVEAEIKYPATVVDVIDDSTLAINRGRRDGIERGQIFLIYELSDKLIIDPTDGRVLGYLEIAKGTGEVINVQENMSTIKSDMEERLEKEIERNQFGGLYETIRLRTRKIPFDDPKIGDKAKPIG
jgi:hypothetical protein